MAAIDSDGNERPGIRLPEVEVPLGTFCGWRLRSEATGATWAIVGLQGYWFPFSLDSHPDDPRPGIRSRYQDVGDYVDRCRKAGAKLVARRLLLERDVDLVAQRAAQMYDWVTRT